MSAVTVRALSPELRRAVFRPRRVGVRLRAALMAVGFAGSIVLANWLLANVGTVQLWPLPVRAPAGVLAAGFVFSFRNGLNEYVQARRWNLAAILVGASISWLMSPSVALGGPLVLALASGAAFAVGELADWAVWTRLRKRGLLQAMGASDLVGQVLDSMLFLLLAFGSLDLLIGQILGKAVTTWANVAVLWLWRRW